MDLPAVNEISEFWFELFPPILLGFISICGFLWVLGDNARHKLMQFIIADANNRNIKETDDSAKNIRPTRYDFIQYIVKLFGLDSIKPLVALSLIVFFLYGLSQLLLLIFPPLLGISFNTIFFAAEVDDSTIASLWLQYPTASFSELPSIIIKPIEDVFSQETQFLYYVESFIRFDLFCCFMFFALSLFKRRNIRLNKKIKLRLFAFGCILLLLLAVVLLLQIHNVNFEVRQICYEAEVMLSSGNSPSSDSIDKETFRYYLDQVQAEKQWAENSLFYGAYVITNRFGSAIDFINYLLQELIRFINLKISSTY